MPPAEWPQVTLGGRTYTAKAGMLANYELSKSGTDPADALTFVRDATDPKNFSRIVDIWRACTAHEFKLANPPQPIPSAEAWIAAIEAEKDPDAKLLELAKAVGRALLKWLLERPKKAADAPAETTAAENPSPTPTSQQVN